MSLWYCKVQSCSIILLGLTVTVRLAINIKVILFLLVEYSIHLINYRMVKDCGSSENCLLSASSYSLVS